jgi:hypothetical protein
LPDFASTDKENTRFLYPAAAKDNAALASFLNMNYNIQTEIRTADSTAGG